MKELLKVLEFTADRTQALADSQSVAGEPLHVGDVTLIPVSSISCGFAGGGSDLPARTRNDAAAAGSGARLLPLHIYLAFTPEAGFSFYARYAFLTIRPGSGPNEKLMEQIFTLLGLRDVSSTANARSAVSAKGVAATLRELGAVLRTLLGRVFWLLHRGTFRRFSLHIAVGAGDPADAALDYGMVCAALYPVLGLLQSAIRFRRPDVAVTCTEEPQTNVEFSAKFSLRAILIVRAFFHLLAENVRNTL